MRLLAGSLIALFALACPALAADPIVPNPTLTPGDWQRPPTPLSTLCQPNHTKLTRHVTKATKGQVFLEYGYNVKAIKRQNYEIDHLVPLSLDGTNDIKNLWPQSYVTAPNAHNKDVLEDALHRLVCHGKLDLATAQHAIASDWRAAYAQYVLHNSAP